jgi:Ca-activated chloride channel homolog
VITKLNQSLLERIADQTGGLYSPATPGEKEIEWIYKHMESLDKKEFKQRLVIEREDHFQLFLAFAILLVLVEMLVGEVRRRQHVTV